VWWLKYSKGKQKNKEILNIPDIYLGDKGNLRKDEK